MAVEAGGIGARLRAGREKIGLTVLQVAERIHTDPKIVEAIEAENYEALGAPVYARGHIRHYAELVGESAAELIALYSDSSKVAQPDLTRIVKAPSRSDSSKLVAPALFVIAVFAVAGAVWWVSALSKKKPQLSETHVVGEEAPAAASESPPDATAMQAQTGPSGTAGPDAMQGPPGSPGPGSTAMQGPSGGAALPGGTTTPGRSGGTAMPGGTAMQGRSGGAALPGGTTTPGRSGGTAMPGGTAMQGRSGSTAAPAGTGTGGAGAPGGAASAGGSAMQGRAGAAVSQGAGPASGRTGAAANSGRAQAQGGATAGTAATAGTQGKAGAQTGASTTAAARERTGAAAVAPTKAATQARTAPAAEPPSSGSSTSSAAGTTVPPRSKNQAQVTLRYSADSWTEVYDASGARLFYDVGAANSVQTVVGKPPLRVVLGNASGVAVEFNGRNTPVTKLALPDGSVQFSINRSGRVVRAKPVADGG
jgi:cytoskeletal protein RodZ